MKLPSIGQLNLRKQYSSIANRRHEHDLRPRQSLSGDSPSFLRCQPCRHRSHSESPRNAGTAGGLWWKRSHAREDEQRTGPCHVATSCYLVIVNANPNHSVVVVVYRSRTTDLPGYRTPFQGASSFDVYPGLKPLG